MAWRVLVPIKHSALAKRRLREATRSSDDHVQLVHAIQLDTLDAVLAVLTHPLISGLAVVADELAIALPAQIEQLPDAGGGLNAALRVAARELAARFPDDGVVVMVGDLPALRSADLLGVLATALQHDRSFVRDLGGTGTTLLAASSPDRLAPQFGPDSAERHLRSGAYEIEAPASVRCDVDSVADLKACLALGAGLLTSQLASHLV
ncbi:MAG TPA: 2-phospho-L-lactate guanylyltransferase [Jatrophihabitans sp.]|nr:2-phospho-L-lactate guanylyltransferase [Jatrophihabitans sp.]